jgi:hypothetical protein
VSDYIRQQVKDIDKRVKEIDAALAAYDNLTQERALLLAAREALAGDRAQPRPNVRRSRSRAQPRRRNKRSNQDLIIDLPGQQRVRHGRRDSSRHGRQSQQPRYRPERHDRRRVA